MALPTKPAIVAEISRLDIETCDKPASATISKARHLASYSWLEAAQPTIAIPGSPTRWSPPAGPQHVRKDSGLIYIAQNAARHPDSPVEPLFRALYAEQPSFDVNDVDIVTDRNNLRKLLSFVHPGSGRNAIEPFTIDTEVNNATVILCRAETETTEFIGPNDFHGYGHEFEKAYTAETTPGSTSHHRIVSYQFGGMSFIVRCETDAFVADTATCTPKGKNIDSDGLSSLLSSLSLTQPNKSSAGEATTIPGSKLRVTNQGYTVPPESIIEIKTRAAHRRLGVNEVAPQLWFSQTLKLVRAYHDRGIFQEPTVEDVAADVKKWENDNQVHLQKLAALVKRIVQVVKKHGGRTRIKLHKYLVNPQQLPYFKSFTGYRDSEDAVPWIVHDDIAFLGDIDYSVRHGFRHFFRRVPAEIDDYRRLSKSLQFLKVDVLEGRTLHDLMIDMRAGKKDYGEYDGTATRGNKSLARDAAFRLVHTFLEGVYVTGSSVDKNMAYNATFFVVSHPGIFRDKTRAVVRKVFEDRFGVTYKQSVNLDKWNDKGRWNKEEDGTTEEEHFDYDSDGDSWYR
ncbi:hypothetical protein SBRCBS47491_001634 [Sporothrix bragantina]|uniref:Geranylgeranyl pyrophosphate synthetase n=1 Tax=Sporothrix bragantina TaxID=671064 RepID=A0ABP0B073_9PEZI